jgi:hypothetical protein
MASERFTGGSPMSAGDPEEVEEPTPANSSVMSSSVPRPPRGSHTSSEYNNSMTHSIRESGHGGGDEVSGRMQLMSGYLGSLAELLERDSDGESTSCEASRGQQQQQPSVHESVRGISEDRWEGGRSFMEVSRLDQRTPFVATDSSPRFPQGSFRQKHDEEQEQLHHQQRHPVFPHSRQQQPSLTPPQQRHEGQQMQQQPGHQPQVPRRRSLPPVPMRAQRYIQERGIELLQCGDVSLEWVRKVYYFVAASAIQQQQQLQYVARQGQHRQQQQQQGRRHTTVIPSQSEQSHGGVYDQQNAQPTHRRHDHDYDGGQPYSVQAQLRHESDDNEFSVPPRPPPPQPLQTGFVHERRSVTHAGEERSRGEQAAKESSAVSLTNEHELGDDTDQHHFWFRVQYPSKESSPTADTTAAAVAAPAPGNSGARHDAHQVHTRRAADDTVSDVGQQHYHLREQQHVSVMDGVSASKAAEQPTEQEQDTINYNRGSWPSSTASKATSTTPKPKSRVDVDDAADTRSSQACAAGNLSDASLDDDKNDADADEDDVGDCPVNHLRRTGGRVCAVLGDGKCVRTVLDYDDTPVISIAEAAAVAAKEAVRTGNSAPIGRGHVSFDVVGVPRMRRPSVTRRRHYGEEATTIRSVAAAEASEASIGATSSPVVDHPMSHDNACSGAVGKPDSVLDFLTHGAGAAIGIDEQQHHNAASTRVTKRPNRESASKSAATSDNGAIASKSKSRKERGGEGGGGGKSRTSAAKPKWTSDQDIALRKSVKLYAERNWKAIALLVPDRDHIQCLQRWKKVLKPGLVKGAWSPEEDACLLQLIEEETVAAATAAAANNASGAAPGSPAISWATISLSVQGRTAKSCRERWCLNLDPSINRGPWSEEEDKLLVALHHQHGNKWATIRTHLKGRTENSVKTRFKTLERLMSDTTVRKKNKSSSSSSSLSVNKHKSSSKSHAVARIRSTTTTTATTRDANADDNNDDKVNVDADAGGAASRYGLRRGSRKRHSADTRMVEADLDVVVAVPSLNEPAAVGGATGSRRKKSLSSDKGDKMMSPLQLPPPPTTNVRVKDDDASDGGAPGLMYATPA